MLHQKLKIVNRRRISQSEIRNSAAEARAGKNSFPPTPFLFASPSVQFGARSAPSVPFKKGSDFVKQTPPEQKISPPMAGIFFVLVGPSGLEPETSSMSTKRSNQLSYEPSACPRARNRTWNRLLKRQLLCQLSYARKIFVRGQLTPYKNKALYGACRSADPTGFEPAVSSVTGRRFKPAKLRVQLYS